MRLAVEKIIDTRITMEPPQLSVKERIALNNKNRQSHGAIKQIPQSTVTNEENEVSASTKIANLRTPGPTL